MGYSIVKPCHFLRNGKANKHQITSKKNLFFKNTSKVLVYTVYGIIHTKKENEKKKFQNFTNLPCHFLGNDKANATCVAQQLSLGKIQFFIMRLCK